MSYKITVLKVDVTKAPKGYFVAEIAYKTEDGKTKGMKVLDFVQKDVFKVVKDAKPGDILNANFEQNAKGYWQFAHVVATGTKGDTTVPATASGSPAATTKSPGNWETSAERATRQVMIVRQSSLSNAINFSELIGNKKADLEDIVAVAKVFEGYVLGTVAEQPATGEVT